MRYADPILRAQSPDATMEIIQSAESKSKEIWSKTQHFVLRRTAEKIYEKLPPRNEYIVFYNLQELQEALYLSYLGSDIVEDVKNNDFQEVFPLITALKKIVTHPDLIFYRETGKISLEKEHSRALKLFPEDYKVCKDRSAFSPKLKFTLELISRACDCSEKVIVGSYWNKALDIVKCALDAEGHKVFKVNGSTPPMMRTRIIDEFNECRDFAVLLLNCKAGGTGLNIVGASRMILYDADWNPKNDSQAMARIWRPGQDKEVHIYRLIGIGTIEEKIYERQISKENLSLHLIDRYAISKLDSKFLKELFHYNPSKSSFSSFSSASDCENSWLDYLSPYFKCFKKVQAEWEKLQEEDCILSNPVSQSDASQVDWLVMAEKKLLNDE
jgi:DNA repair and recombination protein RAD54B